jgi:hypothetical protein
MRGKNKMRAKFFSAQCSRSRSARVQNFFAQAHRFGVWPDAESIKNERISAR